MKSINRVLDIFQTFGPREVLGKVYSKSRLWFLETFVIFGVRYSILKRKVKHIHGPAEISYSPDELLLTCTVRNGELYIDSFMRHYQALGIKHFVFMDNGSTDRTIEMLTSYDNVTILQTDAKYSDYEGTMKRYMTDRFSKGRWNLFVDIDELFDYPYSSRLSLCKFHQYLDAHQYTAVICQMLNLFADIPFAKLESYPDDSLSEKYPYYDNSAISKTEYRWSKLNNGEIKMHWGGICKTLFDTNSGLTKASLVKVDGKVKTFVGFHQVRNANIADVSCVLKHYNFIGTFYKKLQDSIENLTFGKMYDASSFHSKTWSRLQDEPDLSPKLSTARYLDNIDSLIDEGFILVSDQYKRWVDNNYVD